MLAQAGAHVLVADILGDEAEQSAVEASAHGHKAVAMKIDATKQEGADLMVEAAIKEWGRLDVGVNIVGGGGGDTTILDSTDEFWESIVEQNLYSAVRCSRAYGRAMIQGKLAGSIINIASPAGLRGAPTMGAYGASKAAVINATWTLAVELAEHGIRVNVVVPAFVPRSGYTFGGTTEQQEELARQVVPMGRPTRAEDVAGAIICFASNLTSFSTGQTIVCDGGRLLTNPIFGPPGTR
jgi:NAD(P)-dependent dehydrogenase (short-subunit alcohol dehydrogenase family)